MKLLTLHCTHLIFSQQNITLYIFSCKISHMMFFSVDMCKVLSEIIKLTHTNNLASQLARVFFCHRNLLVLKFRTRYLLTY